MNDALARIRSATAGTGYEGKIYLVGGIVRDLVMGLPGNEDADLVLEGDALELARFLHRRRITDHPPVVYRRFGTAMLTIRGRQVEIVTARSENYDRESRKPSVEPANLQMDALRRDFTVNTLMQNLHTGEILDFTCRGMDDIRGRIIRTPLDPVHTFDEDPLRMLRAIRFSSRLDFEIEPETYRALSQCAERLAIISRERIRDEFSKTLLTANAARGLEMLLETGLLAQFTPELPAMRGVEQNKYHLYDCWAHTMKSLSELPEDANLNIRLATLLHDIGKPATKTYDGDAEAHFYGHEHVGAEIASKVMRRLRFSNDQIETVHTLVELHLRPGSYNKDWTDAAVRRLMRDAGPLFDELLILSKADSAASNPELIRPDYPALEARIAVVKAELSIEQIRSPLDGHEIMRLLKIKAGPSIREAKDFLLNEVLEGRLRPEDKAGASEIVLKEFGRAGGEGQEPIADD